MKKSNKNIILKAVKGTLYCTILLVAIVICTSKTQCLEQKLNFETASINTSMQYVYLSDLDYITTDNWSYNGLPDHSIQKDRNSEGNYITLKINDTVRMFTKGLGLYTKGQLTYDISEFSSKYTRFISKIGIDASKITDRSLWIQILVSDDGNTWNEIYKSENITSGKGAIDVDLNISNHKYLRIYIDSNGENITNYAVLASPMLVTKDYVQAPYTEYDKLHNLEYYDNIISTQDIEDNYKNNYRLILEREFVRKIGYDQIQAYINAYPEYMEVFDWILSNNRILEECIEVGEISNNTVFMEVLSKLYKEYKESLKNKNGNVYEKMMIGLAAAYSTDKVSSTLTYDHYNANYDYMERFKVIKKEFDEGLLLYGEGLKSYHIEMFRLLMQDGAREDELLWLNYIGKAKKYVTSVYAYVPYLTSNYNNSNLWNIDNKQKYDEKWSLTENGVPYGDGIKRYWMAMEEGGSAWNQARFIQAIFKNMGRPSIGIYQPAHESALYYVSQNDDGTGIGTWRIAGNKYGWGKSYTALNGKNKTRTLFNWSDKYFTNQLGSDTETGNSAGYIYLAQANLNNYDAYKKSVYFNLIANSYLDNEKKLEVYNKSIEVNNINLDSYDYKIQMYKQLGKSSEQWHDLANEIIDNFTFYPMAMNDLLKVIRPYLNVQDRIDIDQKEYVALQHGADASYNEILQDQACREIAKDILSNTKRDLAYFSFNGENANKIILSSDYDNYNFLWCYSIDGGITKSEMIADHSFKLSDTEIEKITLENGIKIYITGLDSEYPVTLNYTTESSENIVDSSNSLEANVNNDFLDNNDQFASNSLIKFNAINNEFKTNNFKVEVSNEISSEVSNLEVKSVHLSFDILNELGFNSEGYELNLVDNENKIIPLENNMVKLTIDLNKSKTFKGIYVINSDDTISEIEYKKLNDNQIEIETYKLGKYVIYYGEENEEMNSLKNDKSDVQKTIIDNLITIEDNEDIVAMCVVIGSIVVVIILLVVLFKKVLK